MVPSDYIDYILIVSIEFTNGGVKIEDISIENSYDRPDVLNEVIVIVAIFTGEPCTE